LARSQCGTPWLPPPFLFMSAFGMSQIGWVETHPTARGWIDYVTRAESPTRPFQLHASGRGVLCRLACLRSIGEGGSGDFGWAWDKGSLITPDRHPPGRHAITLR